MLRDDPITSVVEMLLRVEGHFDMANKQKKAKPNDDQQKQVD